MLVHCIYMLYSKDYIKEENDNLKDYQISMSIGVSKVDLDHEAPLEDAIKNADKEMYRVKVENKKERKQFTYYALYIFT